ncbi:TPA: hypothetical protein HA244_06030 [Candidatus Micrarchaeota archaeon]|nr:hypothetical protein [Candidatus Micrarchaeota archaeon]
MVWKKLLSLFQKAGKQGPRVVISGLKRENNVFRESIQEEADAFLEKASAILGDLEGVTIHVKSSGRGKASKFELHSLLSLKHSTITAKAGGRQLNFVLKNLFDGLMREARKQKSKRDKGKKHRDRMVFEGELEVD